MGMIDREETLKAMDTWDKFGNDPNEGLIPLSTPALQDRYVPYVKYDDMVKCVKGMPSVTTQEPTEKIYSKTCGTCKHFRKHRNEKNIEICKELYGKNTICGYCTYWEEPHEVAFPTTEYDYCSHYREVEE